MPALHHSGGSSQLEMQAPTEPRDANICLVEAGGQQQRVVGAFLKADGDRALVNHNRRGGGDEIAKQMARFGWLVSVADLVGKIALPTSCHCGALDVDASFQ